MSILTCGYFLAVLQWGGSSPATSAPTNGNGAVHDFRPFSDRYLDPTLASLPQGLQLFDKTSAASNAIEDQPVYIAAVFVLNGALQD